MNNNIIIIIMNHEAYNPMDPNKVLNIYRT